VEPQKEKIFCDIAKKIEGKEALRKSGFLLGYGRLMTK